MKILIFDSSTLISLAMNGLFEEIRKLKEIFDGKFVITHHVKEEIIDRPMNIKKFELEALQLQKLLHEKVLEMPNSVGINESEIEKDTKEMMDIANSTFETHGNKIHIVDAGEISCFALSKMLNKKGIKNIIAMDERTARMLSEMPKNLKDLLQKKLHTKINANPRYYPPFKNFKIIRSSELVYIIYKRNFLKLKGEKVLDALLYAVKFKGASITDNEISEIKKLG